MLWSLALLDEAVTLGNINLNSADVYNVILSNFWVLCWMQYAVIN